MAAGPQLFGVVAVEILGSAGWSVDDQQQDDNDVLIVGVRPAYLQVSAR